MELTSSSLASQVAALDALGEFDLLRRGEQRVASRVGQQLVDSLWDERVRGADVETLDRAVQPLGGGDRLGLGLGLGDEVLGLLL